MRRLIKSGALVLLLAAILGTCALVADPHPSDDQIARELRDRRPLYEQLLKMVREEKRVTRINRDWIALADRASVPNEEMPLHLPPARHAEYVRLFDALELESGVDRAADGSSVYFLRSSVGLSVSGSTKALVWEPGFTGAALATDDPGALRDACTATGHCVTRRRIAPGWYVFYSGS